MDKIQWTEKFSVGVQKLDEQHKIIIGMINNLNDSHNASVHSEVLHETLSNMMKYAQQHLEYEESLLKAYGYPDFEKHHELHLRYIEQLAQFSIDTMNNKSGIPDNVRKFLVDWWTHHILHEDKQYQAFFNSKGLL